MWVVRGDVVGAGDDVEDGGRADGEVEDLLADCRVEALWGLSDGYGWLCGNGLAGDLGVGDGGGDECEEEAEGIARV